MNDIHRRRYKVSITLAKEVEATSADDAVAQVAGAIKDNPFAIGIEVTVTALAAPETWSDTGLR